jgi:hypothetical protein
MDTVPNSVQLIKFAQAKVGIENARTRALRLVLTGTERSTKSHP